ncbi:MAG: arsenate reductase (glutaredoxin) [Xanthomonadales bacterium]|nr:arsenate reductase (glutaredoxin) [Xanthomonadales bacterium]
MDITLWHNPRCSKSRQALALLRERGIEPHIVEYLVEPPDAAALRAVLAALDGPPQALLRGDEPDARALSLAPERMDAGAVVAALVAHPGLIQRPVAIAGARAVIGRPPEAVLALLPDATG